MIQNGIILYIHVFILCILVSNNKSTGRNFVTVLKFSEKRILDWQHQGVQGTAILEFTFMKQERKCQVSYFQVSQHWDDNTVNRASTTYKNWCSNKQSKNKF